MNRLHFKSVAALTRVRMCAGKSRVLANAATIDVIRRVAIMCGVMFCTATAITEDACAQSLFGSRGPLSQGRSGTLSSAPSGSPTLPSAGSLSPAGALTPTAPGGFIGRGNAGNRFIGAQQVGQQSGQQSAPAPSTVQSLAEPPNGGQLAGTERSGALSEGIGAGGLSRLPVRARERIAFSFAAPGTASIDAALASQFSKLAVRYPVFAELTTEATADGKVILRGEVPTEAERRLAEILVRLQPGVRDVVNELLVTPRAERQAPSPAEISPLSRQN